MVTKEGAVLHEKSHIHAGRIEGGLICVLRLWQWRKALCSCARIIEVNGSAVANTRM